MRAFRLMPHATDSSYLRRLKASTGTEKDLSGVDTEKELSDVEDNANSHLMEQISILTIQNKALVEKFHVKMLDVGINTDTESPDGQEELDTSDVLHMTESQAAEHLFLGLQHAKRRWRRCIPPPCRGCSGVDLRGA